jgi:DNA repair exonuclease SbcCD ATPase subunit
LLLLFCIALVLQVTVEGFGPFAQAISYPLAGRGVVAVTGLNRDDAAAVSNGAGKTSLLTSLLWAFKVN